MDPAVGLLEFSSIAAGIVAADAMVKAAPLGSIYAGTVHPGKYLILVSGDTASVDTSLEAGRDVAALAPIDEAFLPDIHPALTRAIVEQKSEVVLRPEALGVVETASVATLLLASDAGVKAADVAISAVRLADGLGGKSYVLFTGEVAEVEAAVDRAVSVVSPPERLVRSEIVPQLHAEIAHNLSAELRFRRRVALRPTERGT